MESSCPTKAGLQQAGFGRQAFRQFSLVQRPSERQLLIFSTAGGIIDVAQIQKGLLPRVSPEVTNAPVDQERQQNKSRD